VVIPRSWTASTYKSLTYVTVMATQLITEEWLPDRFTKDGNTCLRHWGNRTTPLDVAFAPKLRPR